jgi:hypothetical protein
VAVSRLTFIRPLSPSGAVRPPKGDDRLHEVKFDTRCSSTQGGMAADIGPRDIVTVEAAL